MKVVHMVPGSGGTFYCQNCLRDALLMPALKKLGVDVMSVPMYLPDFSTDGEKSQAPVFFGAVNVYLQQKLGLFRRTPRWLDRLFDARGLLSLVARKSASTSARGLEDMTISMLEGADGNQAKELDRLVVWLKSEMKPDVVVLSNALLLGLAARIKSELGCRIICALQDEDDWVDAMAPEHSEAVWDIMAEKGADVDVFVSVSRYYADKMRDRMRIPPEKIRVVHIGIPLEQYGPGRLSFDPPVIGFVSRLAEALGLGLLCDAFIKLKQEERFKDLRLKATGGSTGADAAFLKKLRKRLGRAGVLDDVEFFDEFERDERVKMLQSVSVLSVPVPKGEAFGMYVIEALACGVPVVEPPVGAYPELIEMTGGGLVSPGGDAESLAATLAEMLSAPERAREMGRRGREAVEKHFGMETMAAGMRDAYEAAMETRTGASERP